MRGRGGVRQAALPAWVAEDVGSSTRSSTRIGCTNDRFGYLTGYPTYDDDISTYAAPAIRSRRRPTRPLAKYQAQLAHTRIAWVKNTGPTDENSYIRIDGPSVWIEFVNARSQSTPNIHYHSVCRDKTNDYGSSKPS